MKDRFKEAMITIGASALMSVLVTYGLLENKGANDGVWAVTFMIVWAMIGVIIALILPNSDSWKNK